MEEQRKRKEKTLTPEPKENDINSSKICFRYPDGDRRVERRFYKTEKVKILYDFVDSLGKDVFNESENYDLIQTIPFKVYSNKEKTLEEEGLHPNSVIQIREL